MIEIYKVRAMVFKWARALTRFTGRGIWYTFLGSLVWAKLFTDDRGPFLGYHFSSFIFCRTNSKTKVSPRCQVSTSKSEIKKLKINVSIRFVLGGAVTVVGILTLVMGVLKSKKLEKVRRALKAQQEYFF